MNEIYGPDTYLEPSEIDVLDFEEHYNRLPLNDNEVFDFIEMRSEEASISMAEEQAAKDLEAEC